MTLHYSFSCGCKIPVVDEELKDNDGFPGIKIDYENIPLECPATWQLISSGRTKGVFQIESFLGMDWCKKIQPHNIEELAALISLIRPGCVSGDTKVLVRVWKTDKKTNFKKITLRQLFKNKNKYKKIISYNETTGLTEYNDVLDVFETGQKEVFKIKVKNSKRPRKTSWYDLECTADHELLTPKGWKRLDELKSGDRFAGMRMQRKKSRPRKNNHGEKYFRDICFKHYEYRCIACDWNKGSLDVNHLEGNRKENNNPENLCFMCPNCHRQYTEGTITKETAISLRDKYKLPVSDEIEWIVFEDKESLGVKDVYDISMKGPHHNFIAGNVIVHNCLQAIVDGKSMTEHYKLRKHGQEEVSYIVEELEPILGPTYGVMVYQEQMLKIAKDIAGFNLVELDTLRKSIGKKDAKIMASLENLFVDGCVRVGIINKEEATTIFNLIRESQRYSFNKSHAVEYGLLSYWSAYAKAHFPIHFYTACLYYAKEKLDPQEEMAELISEAKVFDIPVIPPSLINVTYGTSKNFSVRHDKIVFGFNNIKGLGVSNTEKLISQIEEAEKIIGKEIAQFTALDYLILVAPKVSTTVNNNLIMVGALDYTRTSRKTALYLHNIIKELTAKEIEWIVQDYVSEKRETLKDLLLSLLLHKPRTNAARKVKIEQLVEAIANPPFDLNDTFDFLVKSETELLGVPLTCTKLDEIDRSSANTTCKELADGKKGKMVLVVEILNSREHIIKNGRAKGKPMGFLSIRDESGKADGVLFAENWPRFKHLLYKGNTVCLIGEVSKQDSNSLVVKEVKQL